MQTNQQIGKYTAGGYKQEDAEILVELDNSELPPPFKEDLKLVWKLGLGLIPPENVKWKTAEHEVRGGLHSHIKPTDSSPSLEVRTLAVIDGKKSDQIAIPLLFERGLPFGMNHIRDYPISRKTTKEGNEVQLERIITLSAYVRERLIKEKVDLGIIGNIPVYHVIAFLPAPKLRSDYEVNLVPSIESYDGIFAHYLVIQDRALDIGQVGGSFGYDSKRDLTDRAEGEENPFIKSLFIPDLSSIEKEIIGFNGYNGHLVIISLPFEKPHVDEHIGGIFGFERGHDQLLAYRDVKIGETALSRGTDSGIKSRQVTLDYDPSRSPHIYHVINLGVQSDFKEVLTRSEVTKMFQEIGQPTLR